MSSALRGRFGPDWECAWGQRPQLGWLPPTWCLPPRAYPSLRPAPPPFPSCPLIYTLPFLFSPLLYARARCGRRRLAQVRLSLGFNIGENTGFYLIARYLVLRGNGVVWGLRARGNLDVLSGACTHSRHCFPWLYDPLNAMEYCSENGWH